ncbi:MAG: spiro-SPASM protein [Spirochaetaceae bacterium]|nr:spiro-SPASM protein [Spirochaetaceae bacterium]
MKLLAIIDESLLSNHINSYIGLFEKVKGQVHKKAAKLADTLIITKDDKGVMLNEAFFYMLYEKAKNYDAILYLFGDEPYIDMELTKLMLLKHEQYYADYSFAEGYPGGLLPQIISVACLPRLAALAKEPIAASRNFIFELIKRDINNFDIETEISPLDLRLERIELNFSTKNNATISKNIMAQSKSESAVDIMATIHNHKEFLWAYPNYYNFQITCETGQNISYQPQTGFKDSRFMAISSFADSLKKISHFSEEAVIGLSYLGEASLHPQFSLFIDEVAKYEKFHLHIETSGASWHKVDYQTLLAFPRERLSLIICLDTLDEGLYRQLRGEGFNEAMAFTAQALADFKEQVYIQTMRIKLLEEQLEKFYRHFNGQEARVLIQKYNSYCKALPEDLNLDIAPLERNVCWALKRELTIRCNGQVYLCSQDIKDSALLGNLFKQKPEDIWAAAESYRLAQLKFNYLPLCKKCDEYYIFNF